MVDQDQSKRVVELTSQIEDLTDRTSALAKEMQKVVKIGSVIGTVLPHNYKKVGTEIDKLIAKTRALEMAQSRMSSSGGAVGAARLSAAHTTLTGQGRGGGGYGSGGGPMPHMTYDAVNAASITQGTMNKGSVLQRIKGLGGVALKYVGAPMLGAGFNYLKQGISLRSGLEKSARFLAPGSLRGGTGSLASPTDSVGNLLAYHGYNTLDSAAHRGAINRAIGGTSEEIATVVGPGGKSAGIGWEKAFEAMSNRLRNPIENLIGTAGVLRGGGIEGKGAVAVLQRVELTLRKIEGLQNSTPEYLRRSAIYLEGIQQLSQQQVAISGRLNQRQLAGFQGVVSGLTTGAGFDPSQSVSIARMMMQRTVSPGGGAAGEIFQMRAFGFANPNLQAYQRTAQNRGIDPGMFKKRGLFEYRQFMETASLDQKIQAYLVGLETEYGGKTEPMAYILGTALVPELGQERAKELIRMYKEGNLSTAQIEKFRKRTLAQKSTLVGGAGTVETALGVAVGDTTKMTSTHMRLTESNDKYLNTILEFGNQGGVETMVNLNAALRGLQDTLGSLAGGVYGSDTFLDLAKSIRAIGEWGKLTTGMFTTTIRQLNVLKSQLEGGSMGGNPGKMKDSTPGTPPQ